MLNIFSSNYISRKPVDLAMRKFAENFDDHQKVLDIGCGNKPYAKYFKCKYIGVDSIKNNKVDVIADAWEIPFKDNEFDGIILNQSLEHIEKTSETIKEIGRLLKSNGVCIVTVPQTMKNHSVSLSSSEAPFDNFNKDRIKYWNVDFFRFTKFGLICLFKNFQIIKLKETSGYFGTIFQLINYFFASLNIRLIFIPIYFISNICGLSIDFLFFLLSKINTPIFKRFYETIYLSLTLNYIMIIRSRYKKI